MASSTLRGTRFATLSGSYSTQWIGSYVVLSQNPITNQTTLRLYGTLYYGGGSSTGSSYSDDVLSVAGSTISPPTPSEYRYSSGQTYGYRVYPGYSEFGYTDRVITHNADGTFPATSYSVYADTYNFSGSASGTISGLPSLDRVAPSVSLSLASRTASSLNVSVTASAACDLWEYTTNNGSTWTEFSTTEATSVSLALTGLSPSVSYTIKVRARKKINHLVGTSDAATYTTLGAAQLNSATEIYADASSVTVSVGCEVFNATYTYSLAIKNGADTYLTLTGIPAMAVGTRTITITLTSAQKSSLLSAMANVASFNATYVLTSYNNGTEIGSSTTNANVLTSASASGPGAPSFTYKDNNSSAVTVTGDNQTLIQGQSSLRLQSLTATAKNGASIASYNITIGDATKVSTSGGTVDVGTVGQSGTLALTVTAKDTRGYTSSSSVNVTVYPYTAPSLSTGTVSRDLVAATEIKLTFSGTFTNLGTNTVTAKYRYKKTADANYSAYTSITPTISGSGFSFNSSHIEDFDADDSYNFELVVSDKLVSETYAWTVIQYKPLIAYRDRQIGINKVPRAGYAVDIEGNVGINNKDLLDFIYPIGSIYMSVNNTDPGTLFGGTWTAIEGKWIVASGVSDNGQTYAAGTSYAEQLPNIKGKIDNSSVSRFNFGRDGSTTTEGALSVGYNRNGYTGSYGPESGSKGTLVFNASNSNSTYTDDGVVRPTSFAVNMWQRTA